MSNFKEEVTYLLKPYLRDESNVDYLALKLERLHNEYAKVGSEDPEDGNE